MMGALLCALGLHRWGYAYCWDEAGHRGLRRLCARCRRVDGERYTWTGVGG